MKIGFIVFLITLSITTTWGDDKHCTSETMPAKAFFEALEHWDKKLEDKKEKLAVPSIELTEQFELQSKYHKDTKIYSRDSIVFKEFIEGPDRKECKVYILIEDSMSPRNTNITLSKGTKRTFKQLRVWQETSLKHNESVLELSFDGIGIQVVSNTYSCRAGDITKALRSIGIKTRRFMSPKTDVNCTPQFAHKVISTLDPNKSPSDTSNRYDSDRGIEIEQERGQDTGVNPEAESIKAIEV